MLGIKIKFKQDSVCFKKGGKSMYHKGANHKPLWKIGGFSMRGEFNGGQINVHQKFERLKLFVLLSTYSLA